MRRCIIGGDLARLNIPLPAPAAMIGVWQTGITHLTGDELLLFERAYRTRHSGLTRMQTGSPDGTEARDCPFTEPTRQGNRPW
jgi:hypothetical protein